MEQVNLSLTKDELSNKLLPFLLDKVFHVTSGDNLEKIKKDGAINSNIKGAYPSVFPQSSSNYGARKGMVCMIDLRDQSLERAEELATGTGYYFLCPKSEWSEVIFLILSPDYYADLKLQSGYNPPNKGENYLEMKDITKGTYVPGIECWYPDKIPLDKIEKVIIVKIKNE